MLPFYLYILQCADGSYYVGHTDDIHKRLWQHAQGKGCSYTSKRLPVQVKLVLPCKTRVAVLAFEHKVKRWSRLKKEAFIQQNWNEVSRLAKKEFEQSSD
jgi:predicted GIY-YIG superfamily endonuclease